MCGINGCVGDDGRVIAQMNRAIAHRGPDGEGTWCGDGIALGHRRLAILDLSTAADQPMISHSGDLVITYNGEIYNFRELRRELSSYPYRSQGDTEVVLAAYEAWGPDCVERFNGIFSFAIWDRREQELFIARDQIGVKPLYYFHDGEHFAFSSELKGLIEDPLVPRRLNYDAFTSYMRLLYVPGPITMITGVRKLPAGHRLFLRGGELSVEQYFSLRSEAEHARPIRTSFADAAASLRGEIEEGCRRQLVSDRSVGVYLSGGVDSSSVLAATVAARGSDIDTYSVGYALADKTQEEKFNADFFLARETANHFGTRHHEHRISSEDVVSIFEESVCHSDEPISNPTLLAQVALAKFTKPTATVVLSGDGGDELFGGYDRYRLALISEWYQRLTPRMLRSALSRNETLAKLATPSGVDQFRLFMYQKDESLNQTLSTRLPDETVLERFERDFLPNGDRLRAPEALMRIDRESWLVDESLMRIDKATMSAGVEGRVPLLDRKVVDYALRLPLHFRLTPRTTKRILKTAFRDALPEDLFSQPKRGWVSPGSKWLRHPQMVALLREVLCEEYHPPTASLFDWESIRRTFTAHVEDFEYHLYAIWALATFQIWARNYRIAA
jgi:asparagine synthase (glutamine-hydrolysing)